MAILIFAHIFKSFFIYRQCKFTIISQYTSESIAILAVIRDKHTDELPCTFLLFRRRSCADSHLIILDIKEWTTSIIRRISDKSKLFSRISPEHLMILLESGYSKFTDKLLTCTIYFLFESCEILKRIQKIKYIYELIWIKMTFSLIIIYETANISPKECIINIVLCCVSVNGRAVRHFLPALFHFLKGPVFLVTNILWWSGKSINSKAYRHIP